MSVPVAAETPTGVELLRQVPRFSSAGEEPQSFDTTTQMIGIQLSTSVKLTVRW